MAETTGPENHHLIADLKARGPAWSFLQAYRTLSRLVREQGGDPDLDLRMRPALTLALPRAGVHDVTELERPGADRSVPGYTLQTSFLGLYGASSPLPNFYTEDLIAAEQEDAADARALLDVFHQRMFALHARSLEKHQPVFELTEQPESHFQKLLWSLVGLRDPVLRAALPRPQLFLRYLQLYALPQRSAAGLEHILSDYLDGVPVTVQQCLGQQVEVPERERLGLGMGKALGRDAMLGSEITSYSERVLVILDDLAPARFQRLLGDREEWLSLCSLIRTYVGSHLEVELELRLAHAPEAGLGLGQGPWNQVGLTSWLGQAPAGQGQVAVLAVD